MNGNNFTLSRKSKHNLSRVAYLKVPEVIVNALEKLAKDRKIHWSELARDILESYLTDGVGEE